MSPFLLAPHKHQHKLTTLPLPSFPGGLEPVNFDPLCRPRRQDLSAEMQESGNFYVTRAALVRIELQLQAGRWVNAEQVALL